MEKAVIVERRGAIAIVRFDRGMRLNAMGPALIGELTEVAKSFQDDLTTSVIVVTGTGEYFSSGADLKDKTYWDETLAPLERRHLIHAGGRLAEIWETLPQVTIAAISGLAIGAGAAFALASDLRVMDRDAYFYMPEVRLGMNLQWNTVPRLVSLAGPAATKRMLLLCEKVFAPDLLDLRVIDRISETPGGAIDLALEWAELLQEMDPLAMRMVKQGVTAASTALNKGLSYADADQTMLMSVLNASMHVMPEPKS